MRRPALTMFAVFLATVLASSVIALVLSGVSRAETSSEVTELTEAPVPASPSNTRVEAKVLPVLKEKFPAYSHVVDNSEKKRFAAPRWKTKSSKAGNYGAGYRVAKSSKKTKAARYKVKIPETDVYSVFAWWPGKLGKNASARIGVETYSGLKWSKVNQSKDGGYWVPVGEYKMKKGDRYAIRIAPGGKAKSPVAADAVAVVRGVLAFPPDPSEKKSKTESSRNKAGGETTYSGSATSWKPIRPRAIVRRAGKHIGTPYGNSRCRAFVQEDCSCFTKLSYNKWRKLPDSPKWQWRYGKRIPKYRIRRGDLVFFDINTDGILGHWDHVGIYAGNGYVIHANSYYKYRKVHRQKMKYLPGYWGAKRLRYR